MKSDSEEVPKSKSKPKPKKKKTTLKTLDEKLDMLASIVTPKRVESEPILIPEKKTKEKKKGSYEKLSEQGRSIMELATRIQKETGCDRRQAVSLASHEFKKSK